MMQQAGINENEVPEQQQPPSEIPDSINITQEALRLGKIPVELVAANFAKGLYNKKGGLVASPRVQEIIS